MLLMRVFSTKGVPKYLDGRDLLGIPKVQERLVCMEGRVLKKNSWDLAKLTLSLEANSKVWRID